MTAEERKRALTLIYRHTHRDYKGKFTDSTRTILMNGGGAGTILVTLDSLTDAQIVDRLPYAEHCEAKRLAAKAAK